MFKNILSFWKGKDFLTEVFNEFSNMLDDTYSMFESVHKKLCNNIAEPGLKDNIYKTDRDVNLLEKNIRKRIVEHLSVQPGVDINACLVLMSVVKDAERIGDYIKNLYEVTELSKEPLKEETIQRYLPDVHPEIEKAFTMTKKAFLESDEATARELLGLERKVVKTCDAALKELALSSLSVNQAVCLTLIARYYKRITAHLVNVASSVILPISELDFFDEKTRHNNAHKQ